uniref:TIR domain-containing protein n=2 Tax=Hemiselmis andersenii TaxID=464988 RepID=A0A7S1E1T8_HEMAN|mmetsp:Transcript_34463/g.83856  ORF Transcript_34463/g.83856 Transcript_34463/m.83856 type:complete len:317 (+) Transcript_34463:322-1272(+)
MGSEEEGRELEEGLEMRGLRVQDAVNLSLWASSRGSPQTFEQTVRVDVCGSFLSHSWHDNAKVKVGQLRLHLMLHKVYAAASVMALLLALQLLPVGFMIQGLIDSQQAPVWFWPSVGALGLGALVVLWANWTGVYLPARWGPWWSTKETVWLDKSCIDQTSDKTKQAGIARLKDYLAKCDTMVVLLGKTYFNRLWCTYELACFCRMHGQEELDDKLKFVSLEWGWFERLAWLFGCGRVRLSKSEHELLANYSCRDASCFMPKDRGTVLARIREEWGSEEEFDGFVRREFPKLVLKGKERFMWRPVRVLKETLDLLF